MDSSDDAAVWWDVFLVTKNESVFVRAKSEMQVTRHLFTLLLLWQSLAAAFEAAAADGSSNQTSSCCCPDKWRPHSGSCYLSSIISSNRNTWYYLRLEKRIIPLNK